MCETAHRIFPSLKIEIRFSPACKTSAHRNYTSFQRRKSDQEHAFFARARAFSADALHKCVFRSRVAVQIDFRGGAAISSSNADATPINNSSVAAKRYWMAGCAANAFASHGTDDDDIILAQFTSCTTAWMFIAFALNGYWETTYARATTRPATFRPPLIYGCDAYLAVGKHIKTARARTHTSCNVTSFNVSATIGHFAKA